MVNFDPISFLLGFLVGNVTTIILGEQKDHYKRAPIALKIINLNHATPLTLASYLIRKLL